MTFSNDPKPPKFWGGFNAIGASGVRALHGVDDRLAPYLKKMNVGSISYKRNGFDEVVQRGQVAPYLYGRYITYQPTLGFALIFEAVISPEDGVSIAALQGASILGPGATTGRNALVSTYTPFVGDKYVLAITTDKQVGAPDSVTWTVLSSVEGGREYFPLESRRGQSVSHIGFSATGIEPRSLSYSVWASGWDNDTKRYRYGSTFMVPNDPLNPELSHTPACTFSSTGERTMATTGFPAYPERNHFDFQTFVVGRGKLQALVFADNLYYRASLPDLSLPYAAPYLAYSNNHGESWSSMAVPWLTSVLCPTGFNPFIKNIQMEWMGKHATITYIGDGKTLLFVPNAYVSGPEEDPIFAPAMFLGDGTSYTRITWPPDTWEVPVTGIPSAFELVHTNVVAFSLLNETRAGHHGFGEGCFYVWVKKDNVGQIMFTYDFGSTWAFAEIPETIGMVAGAIITPYRSPESPGRIIFAAPDYDTNKLSFFSVGGDFAEFKNMGTVVKAAGDLIPDDDQPYNYFFVNYGGLRYRPYVFPAYPKEFEKP